MSISTTKKTLSSDEMKCFIHDNKDSLASIDNENNQLKCLSFEVPNYSSIQGVTNAKTVKASSLRRHAYKTKGARKP